MNVKNIMLFLGIAFTATGILGFFNNPMLGLFQVDTLLNILHLITGIAVLIVAYTGQETEIHQFAKIAGLVYAALGVVGLVYPGATFFGMMADTVADNILHIVFAVILVAVGYMHETRMSNSYLRYNH